MMMGMEGVCTLPFQLFWATRGMLWIVKWVTKTHQGWR